MNEFARSASIEISRRTLIRGVAVVGSAPFLAMSGNPAAAYTQQQVTYQDHPFGQWQCSNCTHFIKPHSCLTVEGIISPKGWCKGWTNVPV